MRYYLISKNDRVEVHLVQETTRFDRVEDEYEFVLKKIAEPFQTMILFECCHIDSFSKMRDELSRRSNCADLVVWDRILFLHALDYAGDIPGHTMIAKMTALDRNLFHRVEQDHCSLLLHRDDIGLETLVDLEFLDARDVFASLIDRGFVFVDLLECVAFSFVMKENQRPDLFFEPVGQI